MKQCTWCGKESRKLTRGECDDYDCRASRACAMNIACHWPRSPAHRHSHDNRGNVRPPEAPCDCGCPYDGGEREAAYWNRSKAGAMLAEGGAR